MTPVLRKGRAKMKNIFSLFLTLFIVLAAPAVFAQETSTTGSISGSVLYSNGSVVPGATVKVTGPLGERTSATNDQGYFEVQGLVPGNYTVRVEKTGFKTGEVTNVPVARGVSGLFYLAPGTTDSLGGGRDNPSISGGSALDNLYVADGVSITD